MQGNPVMSYSSSIQKTIRDIQKAGDDKLKAAGSMVRKAIIEKERKLFEKQSGNLEKGTISELRRDESGSFALVGLGPPAYHGHMLEFGTDQRFVKNYRGKENVAVEVGHVKPKPFVLPTFEEQNGNVERVLNGDWGIT
jgi:hypothetical protein